MDSSHALAEFHRQRSPGSDRFHDELLGRLVALRYKALTPAHLFLLLPLRPDPPLLALAMSPDENAMHFLLRDLKFTLPFWLPMLHSIMCLLAIGDAYWVGPVPCDTTAFDNWHWLLPAALACAAAALTAWFVLRLRTVRYEVRHWLGQSDIMARLAANDEWLWQILEHVPQLFHTPFMLVRRNSPQAALGLVGSNLDWYLDTPRRRLRANWLAELALPALALEFALFPTAHSGLASAMLNPLWQLFGAAIVVCLALSAYAARRREVFIEELILALRTQFEN
jgi:hypothetical protein